MLRYTKIDVNINVSDTYMVIILHLILVLI